MVPLGNIAFGFFTLFMAYLRTRGWESLDGIGLAGTIIGFMSVLIGFGASFHERIWAFNRWWFIASVVAVLGSGEAGWW